MVRISAAVHPLIWFENLIFQLLFSKCVVLEIGDIRIGCEWIETKTNILIVK